MTWTFRDERGGHRRSFGLISSDEFWRRAHEDLYGDEGSLEETDQVLDQLVELLVRSGWVELSESAWEGGIQQRLLRRGAHCITAAYDPVTRQIRLSDGRAELEITLQILAEEGVLTEDSGREKLEINDPAIQAWGLDLLTAAGDMLSGRIADLPRLACPVQITVLGLDPHADGSLRAPEAPSLAMRQLGGLFEVVGVSPRT